MRFPRTTHTRARRLALLVLFGTLPFTLLAGCSRHTALTVKVDFVPFLSAAQTQANGVPFTALSGLDVKLPVHSDPNPGYAVDLTQLGVPGGAVADITGVALHLAASVTPSSTIGPGTLSFYIAPSGTADAFQSAYLVAHATTPQLPGGQTTTVTVDIPLDSQKHAAAFQLVRTGSFNLGAEMQASASADGTADVTLSHLLVSVSLPPGWGLP